MNGNAIVKATFGAIRSVRAAWWKYGTVAPQGQITQYESGRDPWRRYVTDAMTFARLGGLMKQADAGDATAMLDLSEETEGKDLHLAAVANTRRLGLTGMEYDIVSAAELTPGVKDKKLADDAADMVREAVAQREWFDEALDHLANAIGPNLAVAELVWNRSYLADILPILAVRLRMNYAESPDVRIKVEGNEDGIPAMPGKFVVHIPHRRTTEYPFSACLSRSSALLFALKSMGVKYWATFAEKYGMPVRWARHKPTASDAEKKAIAAALESIGANAYGMVTEGVELILAEIADRGRSPYPELVEWCSKVQSIGWLGQNLTTDTTGGTGTYAAAKVHDNVRRDILEADIRSERRMIRGQIFAPMVTYAYPGHAVQPPHLIRKFREGDGRVVESQVLEAAQRLRMDVPRAWAHRMLGIPEPTRNEAGEATEDLLAKVEGPAAPAVIAQPPLSFGGDR